MAKISADRLERFTWGDDDLEFLIWSDAFKEEEHPRDPGGKFEEKPDQAGGTEFEKTFAILKKLPKSYKPAGSKAEVVKRIEKIYKQPADPGAWFRWTTKHLAEEAKAYGLIDEAPKLKKKIAESFFLHAEELHKAGKFGDAHALEKKAKQMGYNPGLGISLTPPPIPPAAKPSPPPTGAAKAPEPPPASPDIPLEGWLPSTPSSLPPTPASYVSKSTPADLEKAKKTTGYPTTGSPAANVHIGAFNQMYAGKTLTDPAELDGKVEAFKKLQEKIKDVTAAEASEAAKQETASLQKYLDNPESKKAAEALRSIMGGASSATNYIKSGEKKLKGLYPNASSGMNGVDAALIMAYTASYYGTVNQQLRSGAISPEQYAFAKHLSRALDKLPPQKGTFYRKANINSKQEAEKYKPGFVVVERAFTSTSVSKGVWSGEYHFVIEGHSGRDVTALSHHPSEKEVLFKFNSDFLVTKREGNAIHMREIEGD